MSLKKQDILTNVMAALILYATVIVYQGYQYGQGDQTQILPCLWAQDHPGAYAQDHYVQHYLSSGTNERSIFHFLLRRLGYDQPWIVFLWHALSGIALILAWISIASLFIKNKVWQWMSIAMILILGSHTSTGSNELYYNLLIPSLTADAFASWGLYCWLRDKYFWWTILLIIAGYLQPLVGMQLFLLTATALAIEKWRVDKPQIFPWRYIIIYGIATLPWLYALVINNGSRSDPKGFMDIMEFRLSHHFFASYFGLIHLFLGFIFAVICFWTYKDRLRWMFIFIVAGCFVYEIGVEILRWPTALYTQWWKTTMWMEAFAFIGIAIIFEKIESLNKILTRLSLFVPLVLFAVVAIYRLSGLFGEKPVNLLPWINSKPDEVEISEQAQQMTPQDALFIIPPNFSAFRWYSKRSTYIDYKAMIHNEIFLKDWYARIGDVYQYGLYKKREGLSLSDVGINAISSPSPETIQKWRSLGITHIISPNINIDGLDLIGQNSSYRIYRLP